MKVTVVCSECGAIEEFKETTAINRKSKYGRDLCKSCCQKGVLNPIYNKQSDIPYNIRRSKIILTCVECTKEYSMTYERVMKRREKYGIDICCSCSRKGERNPFYKKHFTEQQLLLFSNLRKQYYNEEVLGDIRRQQQSQRFTGSNNPMYKQNIDKVKWRSSALRNVVLKFYGYTCAKCRQIKHPIELEAHHIVSIANNKDMRVDFSNIACLCVKCHRTFHYIYGRKTTVNQYYSFIESSETIEAMLEKHYVVE